MTIAWEITVLQCTDKPCVSTCVYIAQVANMICEFFLSHGTGNVVPLFLCCLGNSNALSKVCSKLNNYIPNVPTCFNRGNLGGVENP